MSEITGNVTVHIDVEASKEQIVRYLTDTTSREAVQRLVRAYAELAVEVFKDGLKDDYGVRWRDENDPHTWHTAWGFGSFKEAQKFIDTAESKMFKGAKILHRLVTEHSEVQEEKR